MLVLSRKLNEEIVIGGLVRVKILECNGKRVRLGISAPDQVPVIREEILTRTTSHPDETLALVGITD